MSIIFRLAEIVDNLTMHRIDRLCNWVDWYEWDRVNGEMANEVSSALDRAPFPHCDDLVLHAPGECKYCDHYPDRQAERVSSGVNFTGHGPDPASGRRPLEIINRWPGNRVS